MAVVSVRGIQGHARQWRTHCEGRPGRTRADGIERAAGRTAHGPGNAQCPSGGTGPEHGTPAHDRIPAEAGRTALISDGANGGRGHRELYGGMVDHPERLSSPFT